MNEILDPEIELLKSDEFYLFYEMMMQSLKTDDVKEGLNKSLSMLRSYLKSGNVFLYKKNKEGNYVFRVSDSKNTELVVPTSCIINKTKPLLEQKGIFNLDLNLSDRLKNMMLIHVNVDNNQTENYECIIAIINNNNLLSLEPQFWNRLRDTFLVILKRAASYERNVKAITTDLLTGLDNRNSYEMRIQQLNENDKNLIVGVFDLFRLKYINDNFTHNIGDEYIKKAADILGKYWPKRKTIFKEDDSEEFLDTGHCVYRVGGDEFVLLTTIENEHLAQIKASLARDESIMIDLGLGSNMPIGLNFGLVRHNPGDPYKTTLMRADEIMQKDKDKMYIKNNLDRRR